MVGPQEHDGHFESTVLGHHDPAPVVGSIVHHDDSGLPPLWIDCIQVVAQFDQEEAEGAAVVLPTVDSEH